MVLHPSVYASLLRDKIAAHGVKCWLVNTGWTGGPYGVGARMEIRFTRASVRAILEGSLAEVAVRADPVFGLWIPESCPGVPTDVLTPRKTWKSGQSYDEKARELAQRFIANFEQYSTEVDPQVLEASPPHL